ncbi:MAG: helix-turn-helix transcriptional regulator [Myxococcota bacterium]
MREVPAIVYALMRQTFERHGVETSPHLAGLTLATVAPRLGERVDWDELAVFMNRCAEELTEREQEALGERYLTLNRYVGLLVRVTVSPRLFLRLWWSLGQACFPHMDVGMRQLSDGRVHMWAVLPAGYRACPLYFRATAGEARTVTRLLGLGESEVEADLGPRHGHYYLTLPEAPGTEPPEREAREANALARMLAFMVGADEPPPLGERDLQERWKLTPMEARVALGVGRGYSVRKIAAGLGIGVETVRTHLKRVYAKTGARRQSELTRLVISRETQE